MAPAEDAAKEDKRLFLLDAYALIYRAYFSFIKNPRINSRRFNTSAAFGFTLTLLDLIEKEKPTHIAVVFDTAEPTERLTSLTASLDDGLLECDFGEWTGEKLTALAKLPQWRTVQQAPSTFRFPGGESFVELQSRMIATMERLRAAHPGGVVVCFSHADPIKAILTHALGTHLDHFQRVDVGTGSISAIQCPDGAAPIVRMVNSTGGPLAALRSG